MLQYIAIVFVSALVAWGFVFEPRQLIVRTETLLLPRWPGTLHGLRVAALSDVHAGGWHVGPKRLAEIVSRTNAQQAELVLLLGDFVSTSALGGHMDPEPIAAALARLRAPLGVFAVLGNHDWWLDGPRVRNAFESVGIPVLDWRAVEIKRNGARFWLAGIPDAVTGRVDVRALLPKNHVPPEAPLLFMTHNPDVFPRVPAQAALTFAGHTHGGQVRLPILGRPIVPSSYGERYAAGHVVERGRHLFVTTGLGTSIIPVRLGVPPEIAFLTLD